MSVKIDESGRRSVQVEVEVPGTPEEVWQAIATGPGISSWFVPTKMDDHVGGSIVLNFGPGMDSVATMTAWNPPHSFAAESPGMAPGSPPLATEWTVEARSGGTCVVRVVHSLFASTDEWDNQLTSTEAGWPAFFRVLRIYLEHFRGERSAYMSAMGMASSSGAEAWETLAGPLGVAGAEVGARIDAAGSGAPPFAGTVEQASESAHERTTLVRLDEPTPGVAVVGVYNCGGPVQVMLSVYLYGDRASEVVARDEPAWRAMLAERFPAANTAQQV
jgi:uncharacterized protein YndB with AHSA1/START domain